MPPEGTGIFLHPGKSIISESAYYKIIKFIGRGGNAIAFKVLCTSGDNHGLIFALKLQYNLSSEMRQERFFKETKFLKECRHPAILSHIDDGIYELSDGRKFPFIVTNFLPQTLVDVVRDVEFDFVRKIEITCQLLSALHFLQAQMILHRDIKPNNIFMNNNDVFLGDFGLLKKINNTPVDNPDDDIQLLRESTMADVHNLTGYKAMPRRYRTPELVRYANQEDILHIESDVFQLGLVLTELYTGENPLQEADDITSPIRLNKIGSISGTKYGGLVFNQLSGMLKEDYTQRTSVKDLLASFTGLYQLSTINC